MKIKLFGTVCVLTSLSLVACGDDEGSGGSAGTTSGNTTSSATGGTTKATTGGMTTNTTGMGNTTTGGMACELPDTTDPTTCDEACSDLYDCGALECNGAQNCPGFSGEMAEKDAFVQSCVMSCNEQMALIGLIDPANCDDTVTAISGVNAQFGMVCQDGFGQ